MMKLDCTADGHTRSRNILKKTTFVQLYHRAMKILAITPKGRQKRNIASLLTLPALLLFTSLLFSCSSHREMIQWNVELKEAELPITDRCDPDVKLTSVKSPEKPKLIPETEERVARVKVLGIPCSEGEEPPVYEIPVSRVKRITYVSDPLQPPQNVPVDDLGMIEGCCSTRDGFWIFDKFELRGAIGFRGIEDSVVYPGQPDPTVYESSFFGFGRGGSSIALGFEIAGMWDATFLDKSRNLQMGFLTGIWPVDGSAFVPLGFHLRYTFNNKPVKFSDNCNSWYLYGDLGLPLDFQTEAPLIGNSFDYQRFFYGLGIGYDWAISCEYDFSVDIGFRGMNLPLPPYECCPSTPDDKKNPFRDSKVLLLRFGLTF